MADGASGLTLSEMGVSTVKNTAQAVKKQATPFVQSIKQQVTGSAPPVQAPPAAQPPSEGIKSGVFDIFTQAGKQLTGSTQPGTNFNPTQQNQKTSQTPFSPKASQPPDEAGPKMSGTFDLSSLGGNNGQTLFETGKQNKPVSNTSQNNSFNPFKPTPTPIESEEEKKQKIEGLRKKLHDAYYEKFEEKAEGKGQKEETVQERLEREEEEKKQKQMKKQEEEKKKAPIVPLSVQGRQGAHEGLKQKG